MFKLNYQDMFQITKSPALIFNYIDNSAQGKIIH